MAGGPIVISPAEYIALRDMIIRTVEARIGGEYSLYSHPQNSCRLVLDWFSTPGGHRLRLEASAQHGGLYIHLYTGSGNTDRGEGIVAQWSVYQFPARPQHMNVSGLIDCPVPGLTVGQHRPLQLIHQLDRGLLLINVGRPSLQDDVTRITSWWYYYTFTGQ